PEYGFMLAGSFLDAIKYYRLQKMLLTKMLQDALDAHIQWKKIGYTINLSVNLPVTLLDDSGLAEELFTRVRQRDVDPKNICFELLEDEESTQPLNYIRSTNLLRLKGFELAQDDFGRGYNSIYNLISTPYTELKIDKSLVLGAVEDDNRKKALITTVELGKQLGIIVTAEGVESARDMQFLRRIGCDRAQGFFISTAISAESFKLLLLKKNNDVHLTTMY
ncbi:EAL domain-containing protein, partial [Escherichia coli]|nr:EAL domain-containing protein [Escherichia coli]